MVGRFQVMALLQAARATALGYPLDEAESFGLNRAIFYAAAKRGFKGGTGSKHAGEQHVLREAPGRSTTKTIQQDALGDHRAIKKKKDNKKNYEMGDETVEQTDRETLESRRKFYEEVYQPRRDELAKAWTALSKQARSS